MNTLTMPEILTRLGDARPDLNPRFEHTGGGVICLLAGPYDDDGTIYVGTASGNLGWSTADGEAHGEWPDLVATDEAQAAFDTYGAELPDGDQIVAAILTLLAERFPPGDPATVWFRCASCGYITTSPYGVEVVNMIGECPVCDTELTEADFEFAPFEFDGVTITNPYMDPTARFPVAPAAFYGPTPVSTS